MNTLGNGIIERTRVLAIQRAKNGGNRPPEQEMIELKAEFREIINNPIFPLGEIVFNEGGGSRLLSNLVTRNPPNN